MTATATQFPEAFADPRMQAMFKEELAWGLSYASFDAFMRHSVKGVRAINDALELENVDDPFAWDDEEIHNAASTALLTLRNKQHLSDTDFAQLCWLEKSLFEPVFYQACYCLAVGVKVITKRNLGRFAHLVNAEQIQLVQYFDERLDKNDSDTIDEMFPDDQPFTLEDKGVVKPVYAMLNELFELFSDEEYEKFRQLRIRLLEFLTNIS